MRIAIYSPYLDTFGGGERYILTVAEILSRNYQVDLLFDEHQESIGIDRLKNGLADRLELDLSRIRLVKAPLGKTGSLLSRAVFFKNYDVLFCLTDGSIFYSTAGLSFIHFQVPFKNTSARGWWGKIKLSSWKEAVYNSEFTRSYIEKDWPIRGRVIYPPVDVARVKPLKKELQILSVGRFTSFNKSKKHLEMIESFVDLYKNPILKGWSLHLAGSVEGDNDYLQELKSAAGDAPVFFYPDLSFAKLMDLYGHASLYWHAAGLGEEDPARMEHFGMTTVEAMAGGCVPIVINKGGQPEIVEDGVSGMLWDNIEQLKSLTLRVAGNPKLREKLSEGAVTRSRLFSKERFTKDIEKLFADYFKK